jgi:hypothetical protein
MTLAAKALLAAAGHHDRLLILKMSSGMITGEIFRRNA